MMMIIKNKNHAAAIRLHSKVGCSQSFCQKKSKNLILTIKNIHFCKFDIKNGFLDPKIALD